MLENNARAGLWQTLAGRYIQTVLIAADLCASSGRGVGWHGVWVCWVYSSCACGCRMHGAARAGCCHLGREIELYSLPLLQCFGVAIARLLGWLGASSHAPGSSARPAVRAVTLVQGWRGVQR
jgi:hypothetical protein